MIILMHQSLTFGGYIVKQICLPILFAYVVVSGSNPYFADEADEIRRLIECGVDGILTNYPRKMLDLLRSC